MLMSVIEGASSSPSYPELAGKRVLITGGVLELWRRHRAPPFADHQGRA